MRGKAEAGATVTVQNLHRGTAKANGAFAVTIGAQKAGTVLQITAIDKAGNVSIATKVIVGS